MTKLIIKEIFITSINSMEQERRIKTVQHVVS